MTWWLLCLLLTPGVEGPPAADAVQQWRQQLRTGSTLARQDAADALGRLGPRAAAAIPDLVEVLDDAALRRPAALALVRIGPRAIPALLVALEKGDCEEAARLALVRLGPAAVPALVLWLKDRQLERRCLAARVLGEIGPHAAAAIPALAANVRACQPYYLVSYHQVDINVAGAPDQIEPHLQLVDHMQKASRAASEALGKMGPRAVPALANVLSRRRPKHHAAAVWSFLTSLSKEVVSAACRKNAEVNPVVSVALVVTQLRTLRSSLQDLQSETHFLAAQALAHIGPPARTAAPTLLRFLLEPDAKQLPRELTGWSGQEISLWLVQAIDDGSLNRVDLKSLTPRSQALRALQAIKPDADSAAPALIAALRHPDLARQSVDVAETLLALGPHGEKALLRDGLPILLQRVQQPDTKTWASASLALELLGARGQPFLPLLDRMLRQKKLADILRAPQTWRIVAKHGKDGLPVLARALEHPRAEVRWAACLGLQQAGTSARPAVPALRRLLHEPNDSIRKEALDTLLAIDWRPQTAVPVLKALLKDPKVGIRQSMDEALLILGPAAKELIPELQARLRTTVQSKDTSGMMGMTARRVLTAAQALLVVGAPEREPLERIGSLLNPRNNEQVYKVIEELGPRARTLAPALLRLMQKAENDDRLQLAWTLAHVAPDRKHAAIPALVAKPLDGRFASVFHLVLAELLGPERVLVPEADDPGDGVVARRQDPELTPLLRYLTQEKEWTVERAALLCRLGPRAGALALPILLPRLRYMDSQDRATAAAALGSLSEQARTIVPRLRSLLKDESAAVRVAAAAALLQLRGNDPALEKLLLHEIGKNPGAAYHLIHAGTLAGRAAVPGLIAALSTADADMRTQAAELLGRLGPAARPAVPRLLALLDDRSAAVRIAVARTLGQIGPAARAARPRLQALTVDTNREVALVAARSLRLLDENVAPFTPANYWAENWRLLLQLR